MSTTRYEGLRAIEYAEKHDLPLSKYNDPTENAREDLTVEEARRVAAEDARLIYLDVTSSALVEDNQICNVSFDDSHYLGSEEDGVYFDAAEGPDGKFYMSATVDCGRNHSVDTIVTDDGPYDTLSEALQAGHNAAYEWLVENHVRGWRTDAATLARMIRRMKAKGE